MKTTKRFFIAFLSFCLLGNMLAKADVTDDGFVYESYPEFNYVFVTGYNGDATSLVFPEFGDGVTVYVNDDFVNSVANANVITEVDFSNVDEVGSGAFVVKTTKKPTPSGLVTVKTGFLSLTKVVLGDKAPEFYEGAFSGVTITELAFSGNTASNMSEFASTVTTVDLSSVTTIADKAFEGFIQLNTIENMDKVASIGASAFSGCAALTSIELLEVKSIGASAFSGCVGLESVDLSNVTSIGAAAFQNCGDAESGKGLETVVWPKNLTVFPASVFSGCAALSTISNLDNATEVGDFAFFNCTLLNGEHEFSALQSVGKDAFWGTSFASVVVRSNLSLGERAFPAKMPLHLIIDDAKKDAFAVGNANTFSSITYQRSFTHEKFATLILPFVPDQFGTEELEVFVLDEATEGALAFVPVKDFVPGTPYMVRAAEGVELTELTGTDQEIAEGPKSVTTTEGWSMNGTYIPSKLYAADKAESGRGYYYYASARGGFVFATGTLDVNPFRTYIEGPEYVEGSNVRMLIRSNDGVETEIDMVELEDVFAPAEEVYYDMNGCRVLAPVKGRMYIVNGKKMIF